jgi:hypothetical protein
MGATARQFCPLCRGELCMADAVRTHLIADHKRSPAEADELIARFDIAQPIPEPEPEPHMYCATEARRSGGGRSRDGGAAAPDVSVN